MRELLALPGRVGVGHRGRPETLLKLSTEGGHELLLKLSHNRCRATNQTEKKKKKIPGVRDNRLVSNCVAEDCKDPSNISENPGPISGCAEIGLE